MPYLYVLQQTHFVRVAESDIILLEGGKIYSTIVTANQSILIRQPLSTLHRKLGNSCFCRVHATYVVALSHVLFFTADLINLGNHEVPIGRRYRDDFYRRITFLS